ncbi:TolC family protein [bacterium SCSIO 12696]|nr:TolC family protein [bacterium SCSIO 12696]
MTFLLKCGAALAFAIGLLPAAIAETSLSLERAITLAQENDPWLSGSYYREQAGDARSVSAGALPGPRVSLGFANLPVDTFDVNQEPMTQFRVGVSQVFPRGKTLSLRRQELREQSQRQPYMRQDRRAQIALSVTRLWLEVYRHRDTIRLIEKDRALFEHLVDVAQSSYTSAVDKTRQQDLVRAQLELTRLEDRLTVLHEQQEISRAQLGEWLSGSIEHNYLLSVDLPQITQAHQAILGSDRAQILPRLIAHPVIKTLDQQVIASQTAIKRERQKYKPQWGIDASYGYRDDDPLGNDRSDFFSVALTFDVPIFTGNRQDKNVEAATATTEALKTDKALALRALRAQFEAARARWERLNQRKKLYEAQLLREIHDQAEAALTAYTNDVGDFSEVVRARIAELNTNIDYLNITIDRLQTVAELNYFLVPAGGDPAGGPSYE